ncbi:MAG TPA: TetR/AcrR family transcriptional regulator [Bradyrhizobium sp.]|nr:TetR/AcrR family transcriptional regulator [Bradyrhizobium sp.]
MAKREKRAGGAALRAPAQTRSRASMEALLDIGRQLIEERGIDDCSMSDVAEAAGSSIGSLYFRFGNRERFINEVMKRHIAMGRSSFEALVVELAASPKAPDAIIRAVTLWIVQVFAHSQGLLRAQLRQALERPQVWRPYQDFARLIVDELIRLLARCPGLDADPDWQQHVRIAMQIVFGTLNNILINRPGPLELDDPRTAEELSLAVVRYLRLEKENG